MDVCVAAVKEFPEVPGSTLTPPSCRVPGTVRSPEDAGPASRETVGDLYGSTGKKVPNHSLGKGGDQRDTMTH